MYTIFKNAFPILLLFFSQQITGQLSIASGDSIYVMAGTNFTLQDQLINNGKISGPGALTVNGSTLQTISGSGTTDNLTIANNALIQDDLTIMNALTMNAVGKLDINNKTINANGSVSGTGLLKGSNNSNIIIKGAGANNTLYFDQSSDGNSNALNNFDILGNGSNTSIANKLNIYNTLNLGAGSLNLENEIILKSLINATARVAEVKGSISYGSNGKFVIQRYIPGRRAWRLLTVPVTAASLTKISDAWQDGAVSVTNASIINASNNPNPGYGTHITYGAPATNGYDQGVNGNPSIRYLDNTGWNSVPTATNNGTILNSGNINDQPGYMLFVRGDRSTPLSQATSAVTTPTVLRPKGKINIGLVNIPLHAGFSNGSSQFRVIGNPYPSSINYHSIASNIINSSAGFADAFYIWDPKITGNNGVGGFVGLTYNSSTGKYDKSVAGSGIDSSGIIQSSTAFMIDYTGPSTSIQIRESDKEAGSNNSYFRPQYKPGKISLSLFAKNPDNSISLNDGALSIIGNNSLIGISGYNLKKLGNFAENISIQKLSDTYCIDYRNSIKSNDSIHYLISKMKQKNYALEIIATDLVTPEGNCIILEDLFKHSKTAVNNAGTTTYDFSVTSEPKSYMPNRFRLIFKPSVIYSKFIAEKVNEDVELKWTVADEFNIRNYEIEHSLNNQQFYKLGNILCDGNSNDFKNYYWKHYNPGTAVHFYRIKSVNKNDVIAYSETKKIVLGKADTLMFVFPNPVQNGQINLQMINMESGYYHIRIINNEGKLFYKTIVSHSGGSAVQSIKTTALPVNAMYHLEITDPSDKKINLQLFVDK